MRIRAHRAPRLRGALTVALVGVLVAGSIVAPLAATAAACGIQRGAWTTLAAPPFPEGPRRVNAFSVDPRAGSFLIATNGRSLARSTDGGCTWKGSVIALEQAGSVRDLVPRVTSITSLVIAEAGRSAGTYAVVEEATGPVTGGRIVRSTDGGATWVPADGGLPPAGALNHLRVSPSDPKTLYVVVQVPGVTDILYASTDRGTTWQPRSNLGQSIGATVTDLDVDPIEPRSVWASSTSGLYHSTDGGSSFSAIDDFAGKMAGPVDVFHARGAPASVLAFLPAERYGLLSDDGGAHWLAVNSPRAPTSIVHGAVKEMRVITAGGGAWAYSPAVFSWVNIEAPTPGIRGLIALRTGTPAYYGHTGGTIEIYRGATGSSLELPPGVFVMPDVSILDPTTPPPPQDARLTPRRKVVRIDPGESKDVRYRLQVPKTKTPLDVYFVVDTSSSMGRFLRGLAIALQDIVNGLVREGVDVRFGLAEYRDYPTSIRRPGEEEPSFIYKRDQDLAPSTDGIEAALEQIRPEGGGYYNAQLAALWQTATGEGEEVYPPGPANDVPPGLQANFRKEALRVVVLVSDSPFIEEQSSVDRNDPTSPAPDDLPQSEEVAAALRARGIHQVGISLKHAGDAQGTADMVEMARATDALAPPGGVDCDGDGVAEVQATEALVCEVDQEELTRGEALVPAMVNLVEAIRTRSSLRLAVDGPDKIVGEVSPDLYRGVILQAQNRFAFDVTFHCPLRLAGERFDVGVSARGLSPMPQATASVVCRKKAKDRRPPLLEALPPVIGIVAPALPPPPTQVVSSTSAQAQTQAQAQANAAMAAQEQEQPQVAMVHAFHQAQREAVAQSLNEEYKMSSLRRDEPAVPGAPGMLAGAALLMGAATSFALRRERRSSPAPARNRR